MLKWIVLFAVVAVVFGLLGFVFHIIAGIAKVLFFLFLIGFVISVVMHLGKSKTGS
jgi:uncharacterized membrane protein YtjA (UPF0391 family)